MLHHLLCFCRVLVCSAQLLPGQAGVPLSVTFTGTGSCSYAAYGSMACRCLGTGPIASFGRGFVTGTLGINCTTGTFAFSAKFDFGMGNNQASAGSGFGPGWTHEWIYRQAYREAQNGNPD